MKKRISKIEIRMYSNMYLYLPARYICICHIFIKQISTSVLAENETIGIQMCFDKKKYLRVMKRIPSIQSLTQIILQTFNASVQRILYILSSQ